MSHSLILASSSPRRLELLRNAHIPFIAKAANIPEDIRLGEAPQEFSERLAFEKASIVKQSSSDALVLGADTIVVVEEHVLGKPTNADDARRMLRLLSGRKHQVLTSVCLVGNDHRDVQTETTQVHFNEVTNEEIEKYIATGEPMDKAGAYGIQGIASRWIPRVEGCYFNVMGLPVSRVYRMLRSAGFTGIP